MKIIVESTDKIISLEQDNQPGSIPARIWEGKTESGIPIHCYITRVAVAEDQDHAEFEKELQAHGPASAKIYALPARLII